MKKTARGLDDDLNREAILSFPNLTALRMEAEKCRRCPLWERGTQTVFGEGPSRAEIVFIGEQPGFQEDIEGKPFIGPAGQILDRALEEAGIDRTKVYVTNAVKHFKWMLKGKKHMHEKPNAAEILACKPWLEAELKLIQPKIVICLGSTAAQTIIRKNFKVTQERGIWSSSDFSENTMATVHPSSILRIPDQELRHAEMKLFIKDLKKIPNKLGELI